MKRNRISPWSLTLREADIMDAMTATGCYTETARRLTIAHDSVRQMAAKARGKMNEKRMMRAVVLWDRWRRMPEPMPSLPAAQ